MRKSIHLLVLLPVIAPTQLSLAQTSNESSPVPTFHAGARLVQVDVIARSKGIPAAGLTKQDFTLFDNAKKQEISFFSERSARGSPPALGPGVALPSGAVTNRMESGGETFATATVLLVDQKNTPQVVQAFAIQRIAKFVRMRRRNDRIAIYTFGKDHILRSVQELTDDSDLLSRAVATLKARDPSYRSNDTTGMTEHAAEGFTAIELMERGLDTKRTCWRGSPATWRRCPGGRSVIWITTSFPLVAQELGIDFTPDMETAARALNDSNIALYAVDARGLSGALSGMPGVPNAEFGGAVQATNARFPQQMGARRNNADPPGLRTMNLLANLTGGLVFYNKSNALEESIQAAVNDGELVYTLGFYPAQETQDGAWHKLKVRVESRGLNVRYRENYFAAATSAAVPDRPTLEDLLRDPLDATQMELVAGAAPDPSRPGFTQIRVNVDLHDVHLEKENAKRSGGIDVSFVWEGSGIVRTKTLKIEIPDDQLAAMLGTGIDAFDSIETMPASAAIRVMVQDRATGAAGSVRIPMGKK